MVVANHHKLNLATLAPKDLWPLWSYIHGEVAYDDTHPRFAGRTRLFPYDQKHNLYPDETNDNTMQTGLNAAWKLACRKQLAQ